MTVSINTVRDEVKAVTPYNAEFVERAKALNGRWDADAKAWSFDARDEQRVRALCVDLFGTDGTATDLVDVQINADRFLDGDDRVEAFGLTLARRTRRDSRPTLADNVVIVEGSFSGRGGSVKSPKITSDECRGVVLEVRDVPRAAVEAEIAADLEWRRRRTSAHVIECNERCIAKTTNADLIPTYQARLDEARANVVTIDDVPANIWIVGETPANADDVKGDALAALAAAVEACRVAGLSDSEIVAALEGEPAQLDLFGNVAKAAQG